MSDDPFAPWRTYETEEEAAARTIIECACAIYGVQAGDFHLRRRSEAIDTARAVSMAAVYDLIRSWTAARIARRFKRSSHSQVLRARDRCNGALREEYVKFREAILTHPDVKLVAKMYCTAPPQGSGGA